MMLTKAKLITIAGALLSCILLLLIVPTNQRSLVVLIILAAALISAPISADDVNAYRRFTLPAKTVMTVVVTFPFLCTIAFAFYHIDGSNLRTLQWEWVAWENFATVMSNPTDLFGLWRTIQYTTIAVVIETVAGIALGVGLAWGGVNLVLLRSLLVLPVVIPPLIAAMLWRSLLDQSFGGLNRLLSLFGTEGLPWLSLDSPEVLDKLSTAFPNIHEVANLRLGMASALLAEIWQWTPFIALVIAAGMRAIPKNQIEWARAQGANAWRLARMIYWPYLQPLIIVLMVLRFIDCLKTFETIWVFFGNNTETATTTIRIATYTMEIRDFGQGAALSVVYLTITLIIMGLIRFRLVKAVARSRGG